ncbi:TPA: hypothetical protein ACN2QB_002551 [Staphylococcus aureus]
MKMLHIPPKDNKLNENTRIFKLADNVKVNERLSIVSYIKTDKNNDHIYDSTEKIYSINDECMTSNAFVEEDNTDSPVFNNKMK